jgi:hypothetical protein
MELLGEDDALIWQHNSAGLYSSQSFYSIVNFRGVIHVYLPSVWKLVVLPRVHFFLWLLSNNKILTMDNLEKRMNLTDNTCVFYSEPESVCHLFYGCVIAKRAWWVVSKLIGFQAGIDYESIVKLCLCNKKYGVINMITSAMYWCLWKLRNFVHFQGVAWVGMKLLWDWVVPMLQC